MMSKIEKGINPYMTNGDYHADKTWLTSSKLKLLYQDPAKFKAEVLDGNSTPLTGDFLSEGSACHTLILEPEKFDEEYVIFDGFRRQGKVWEEFEASNTDRTILTTPQHARVKRYVDSIRRRPEALSLFTGGIPEQTMAAELQGVKVKARCDYINPELGIIVDLKTSSKPAGVDMFKITIDQYYYQLSAALYMQVAYEVYKKPFDFYFVVVSKADLQTDVYKLSRETAAAGHHMVNKALQRYRQCSASNLWVLDHTPEGLKQKTSDYEVLDV
jgi:exodeoxyribonuclease VIII